MLVAVLVTFGVLSKKNEITAFKACGVSLYRLALPILIGSTLLSGGLFAFDHYYVPGRQPEAGGAARRDQGPPHADLSAARPQVDHGHGFADLLLPLFRPAEKVMMAGQRLRAGTEHVPPTRQIPAERAPLEPDC